MSGTAVGSHQYPLRPQEVAEGYIPGAVPHSSQQLSQIAAVAPVGSKTQARAEASNTAPVSRHQLVPTAGHPPCPVFREGWENCIDKPINSQALPGVLT